MLRLAIILSLFLLTFSSCKKDRENPKPQPDPNAVEISGKSYPTVKIGSQTWTSINYEGSGGVKYNAENTRPEYGKYYTFREIKEIKMPAGWRIPTVEDYIKLFELQGVTFENYHAINQPAVKKLVSKTNWKNISGSNTSGFNAYPAGYSYNNSAPIDGDLSEFWTNDGITLSIQEGANLLNHRVSFYSNSNDPAFRFNLRFLKDN
jgi:uncharacterized protein (TIGR02145 family)